MTNTAANPNKALWEKGDFTRIAAAMRESGEALVRSAGVRSTSLTGLDAGPAGGVPPAGYGNAGVGNAFNPT